MKLQAGQTYKLSNGQTVVLGSVNGKRAVYEYNGRVHTVRPGWLMNWLMQWGARLQNN